MVSSLKDKLLSSLIPFPRKLFSCIPKEVEAPEVPIPAPALICPVGFSSTVISIILSELSSVSRIFDSTFLNIFVDLMLLNLLHLDRKA